MRNADFVNPNTATCQYEQCPLILILNKLTALGSSDFLAKYSLKNQSSPDIISA